MGKRTPRLPVASAGPGDPIASRSANTGLIRSLARPKVAITDSDWQQIEKAYGQELSLEARRDIHEKTQEFVDRAEFEQNAEPVSDARDRITTIIGAASSLRSALDGGDRDADIYARTLIKRHLRKVGDAIKKRRRKKDDPLRGISSDIRVLIFASQDALRELDDAKDQNVTITITGSNEAPVITSPTQTGAVTEDINIDNSGNLNAGGTITFTDVDLTDTHTVSASAPTFAWSGGTLTAAQQAALTAASTFTFTPTLTHDATGGNTGTVGWTFSVSDNAVDFLAAGQTLTQTYTVKVADNNGGFTTQGFSKGEAWERWIRRLTSIAKAHNLPGGARKDSDKQSGSHASPFVEFVWGLQQFVPGTHRRAHSKGALAKAITEARRQKRDE
jgi:VCBS repeat-containing protein